jgi:hypothetical protein
MSIETNQRLAFHEAVGGLLGTKLGQEATMYPNLRDLFTDFLGYSRRDILIDVHGRRGRPDLAILAPGATEGTRVSWIVVEAKDEPGAVATSAGRASLFGEKAKYITVDTAYMVMVDPTIIVIRSATMGASPAGDVEIPLKDLTPEAFLNQAAPLHAELGGVPIKLQRFRNGDESLIAYDSLSVSDNSEPVDRIATQVVQNVFFDTLTETTRLLQSAVHQALRNTRPVRSGFKATLHAFENQFGPAKFYPYPISIEGTAIPSREAEIAHRRESAALRRKLAR